MSEAYKKWDICLADVPFEDLPQSKVRPVLILGAHTNISVDCLKMTGQPPREGEYVLQKWKEAGLLKPTTVRLGKRLNLEQKRIHKKIGHLDKTDILNIINLIK